MSHPVRPTSGPAASGGPVADAEILDRDELSGVDVDDAQLTQPEPVKLHDGSFISRLTTGTGAFNVLGLRKYSYWFSAALVVLSILAIALLGFNLGIDFKGGTRLTFVPQPGTDPSIAQVTQAVAGVGISDPTVQTVGSGGARSIQISSEALSPETITAAKRTLTSTFGLTNPVSDSAVSETWGSEISSRAIIGVLIFLVLVALFIWIRYERRAAVGAVVSTLQVIIVTAGIYAAVGFEVTPATVIGLLTILGFSLYDTVVVYDKVQENTRGLFTTTRRTYPEAANLAINQTLMRSINTSLIALLPVAGLLVAGVVILGSGTLKDLSLVMLVGMLVGAYSSLLIAVPIAVDLRMREPQIRAHTARVLAKRRHDGLVVDADGDPVRTTVGTGTATGGTAAPRAAVGTAPAAARTGRPAAPRPGVKPQRPAQARTSAAAAPGVAGSPARGASSGTAGGATPTTSTGSSRGATPTTSAGTAGAGAGATAGRPAGKRASGGTRGARPIGKRSR
ncbi:protein translocase subunit SecF [Nakamurella endophytica]|uniref:Protein-export membrane protein SecF n=1 Tax=Nakamurella endophytica TaxID=1748367 RepID=A0A917T831_9ACTN|nr:protein translocase subunit SecF [Nakamurella endophytica]GGM14085.1 hypothetical protein GCM10011594_37590 [Nakamurella endophytica]